MPLHRAAKRDLQPGSCTSTGAHVGESAALSASDTAVTSRRKASRSSRIITQPTRGLKPAGSSRRCALMKPVSASTSLVGPSATIWPWSSTSDRGHSSSA